jgi:putative Mn2+ efflux pump MntP
MADYFWRRRLRKQARAIIVSLPNIPEDIDDNMFIAMASQAAEADKKSGAADEFMFSEDGYVTMPYEDSVDEFLKLQIERTPERQGRAELPHRLRLEYFTRRVDDKKQAVEDAKAELKLVTDLMTDEEKILAGTKTGEDGANWSGVAPDTTSKSKHAARRGIGWLVFLIVAAIDTIVVFYSLRLITSNELEAIAFTAPAVGVQILFPHLVGKAIGRVQRKKEKRAEAYTIAIAIGLSWLLYAFAMTILRMNLLTKFYVDKEHKPLPPMLEIALYSISFMILIGLGSWVMIRAMHDNPHEEKFSRLSYVFLSKRNKLRSAMKSLSKAEAAVEAEKRALEEVSAQWRNRAEKYTVLGESAKSAYRRALVNQVGVPEFTTSYLPKEKFAFKKPRKESDEK